jgi:hypothetical protein
MSVCQFIVAGVGTGVGIENLVAQRALIAFVCIYIFFCKHTPRSIGTKEQHSNTHDSRKLMGSCSVGRYRRDIPPEGPRQVPLDDHRFQLAPQLGHCVRNTIHGR